MKPRSETFTPASSAPSVWPFGVRATATSTRPKICGDAALSRAQPARIALDACHARAEQDLLIARADAPLERPHQIRIASRHQLRGELDDAHAHPEGVEYARHLEPDDAAADDQQPAGEGRQLEGVGRIENARIVRQPRKPHGLRARGNDALIEVDALRAARAHHFEYVRAHEPPGAAHHIDLALLHEHFESAGQLRDYRALPGTQALHVELTRAQRDAAPAAPRGIR